MHILLFVTVFIHGLDDRGSISGRESDGHWCSPSHPSKGYRG